MAGDDDVSMLPGTVAPELESALAVARGNTGAATIAALTASDVPLRLRRDLRPTMASRRRCRDRASERSQTSTDPRSRAGRTLPASRRAVDTRCSFRLSASEVSCRARANRSRYAAPVAAIRPCGRSRVGSPGLRTGSAEIRLYLSRPGRYRNARRSARPRCPPPLSRPHPSSTTLFDARTAFTSAGADFLSPSRVRENPAAPSGRRRTMTDHVGKTLEITLEHGSIARFQVATRTGFGRK